MVQDKVQVRSKCRGPDAEFDKTADFVGAPDMSTVNEVRHHSEKLIVVPLNTAVTLTLRSGSKSSRTKWMGGRSKARYIRFFPRAAARNKDLRVENEVGAGMGNQPTGSIF